MSRQDLGLSANLAGLFSIRMLGIFLILPIYAEYMRDELGSGGFVTGLFISSYALTQLIMQPLVGALSDRIGRKITIIIGLALFILGSLVIAFTSSAPIAIIGRVIQGAGAISSVILALTSDIVREEIRGHTMAIIGIGIGVTFGVSVVLSQVLYRLGGGMAIFLTSAILGGLAIVTTIYRIPNPPKSGEPQKKEGEKRPFFSHFLHEMRHAFDYADINRLYVGTLTLHLVLTAAFTSFSAYLLESGYGSAPDLKATWPLYLPTFLLSLILMFGLVGYAERFYHHRPLFLSAIFLLFSGFAISFFVSGYWGIFLTLFLFFLGFNVMEATQPSLMSRLVPAEKRGVLMGVFSSAQFIGAATGGMVASLIYDQFPIDSPWRYRAVFLTLMVILVLWFLYAYPMKNLKKPQKEES